MEKQIIDRAPEIVAALRDKPFDIGESMLEILALCVDAAKLIEAQAAEIKRLTVERDGAVRNLGHWDGSMCDYCVNDGRCDIPAEEYHKNMGSCFVWRGLEKEA